ncbi:MATE family efflux transporter [Actinomyces sp. W5033]|uniref:MATE family efflux transporter n=1 Tax=Actinomyces sp. W5033 TaxID=3446479 RepID=UPI003EE36C9A
MPLRALDRRILSLAVPALGALVAEPLFVIIDSAMVGHLGATSLAGLSLASTVLTTVVGLFVFLAYATTATTSRLFGAGDRGGGLRAGVDGLWLALLLGTAAALLLWSLAPWVTGVLGADGLVSRASVAYLRASAPGLPGMLVVFAATGTLRGLLDTRTPFVVATAGAVVNVVLNATFLYAVGMGVAGSGLGTAITQTLMAVALTLPVALTARAEGVGLAPRRAGLGASLGAGAPLLVRTLTLRAAILATVWAATALGEVPLAAHQVVISLWTFTAFCLDALAIAAQALIGTALGQADAAAGGARAQDAAPQPDAPGQADQEPLLSIDAVLRRSLGWGVGTSVVTGLLLAVLSPWLPQLFTSDPQVVAAVVPALLVTATALPVAGAVFLFDGVLMGAGDGVYLARAGLITLVPYLPLTVAVHSGWPSGGAPGLVWLWAAFAWVFMGARVVTTGLRARSDAWRH